MRTMLSRGLGTLVLGLGIGGFASPVFLGVLPREQLVGVDPSPMLRG